MRLETVKIIFRAELISKTNWKINPPELHFRPIWSHQLAEFHPNLQFLRHGLHFLPPQGKISLDFQTLPALD